MDIYTCKNCKGIFQASEFGPQMPGCKDKEAIICPYCNTVHSEHMINGVFRSYKLSEEEQAKYRAES